MKFRFRPQGGNEDVRLDVTREARHCHFHFKKDHDTVKGLFDDFEKSQTPAAREEIIASAVMELKLHAVIEEEIFYPTVRAHVGSKVMNEADEEHHVARVLIAELDENGGEHGHRQAKFTVLAESVRHHIREEETDVLPKAKELDIDFEALGQRMLDRKKELKRDGIPSDDEHAAVAAKGKTDSPAAKAAGPRKARAHKPATKPAGKSTAGPKRRTTSHASR